MNFARWRLKFRSIIFVRWPTIRCWTFKKVYANVVAWLSCGTRTIPSLSINSGSSKTSAMVDVLSSQLPIQIWSSTSRTARVKTELVCSSTTSIPQQPTVNCPRGTWNDGIIKSCLPSGNLAIDAKEAERTAIQPCCGKCMEGTINVGPSIIDWLEISGLIFYLFIFAFV